MAGFELSKWYADCASEQGEAAIVYQAELRWHALTLHYSTLLTKRAGCAPGVNYSMRKRAAPEFDGNEIVWASAEWKAAGKWRELGREVECVLFNAEAGCLEWSCMAPRAAASVEIGDKPAISGWGYAEHLRLSVAPWQLPIRRLRWGRFVNATDALVWIDWSGSYNKRAAYLNGAEVSASEIDDSGLVLAKSGAALSLDKGSVLREGALGETALSIIPNLNRLFPDSILNMRECKWLSRAVLRRPGQLDSEGMAIHEVVEWP